MTLGELLRDTEKKFRAARLHYGHGTNNARDEAAFLVLRALRLPFEGLPLEKNLAPQAVKQIGSLIRKRIEKRIPVAYLLNEAWLDGHAFHVDRRVIIPRSHIAFLLKDFGKPKRVLDLCTGSGCLAILAAHAFPLAQVDASDLSKAALKVAAMNVKRHKLGGRVRLVASDLFSSLQGRTYDLIVSNPPYVSRRAMRALPAEYRYEPGLALAGGADGLQLVRSIVEQAPAHLSPGGILACEVGSGRKAVERVFPRTRFPWLRLAWPAEEVFVYEKRLG